MSLGKMNQPRVFSGSVERIKGQSNYLLKGTNVTVTEAVCDTWTGIIRGPLFLRSGRHAPRALKPEQIPMAAAAKKRPN